MKTKVYIGNTACLKDDRIYDKWYAKVDDLRRKKIDTYYFKKDRCLSLGAGILLKKALSDLGICDESIRISYGENLKPYLADYPEIYFNLSHSGEMVMCAVSDREVGCDVEQISEIDLEIARKFFYNSEYKYIMAADQEERYDRFFRMWTLKESFMKCTGLGMLLALDAFCIQILDEAIRVKHSVNDKSYCFQEFSDVPGYRIACCYERNHVSDSQYLKYINYDFKEGSF